MLIHGLSHTPHLGLYAQGRDRTLVLSQLAALVTFFIAAIALNGSLGVTSVPAALCAAFAAMYVWKTLAYKEMLSELNAST